MTDNEAIEIHIAENIHRIEVIEDFMHTHSDDAVCRKNISVLSKINGLLQIVQKYRAIGTVEECRAAVEKQKPKKVIKWGDGTEHCPTCDCDNSCIGYRVCIDCGQKLDWSDGE